MRGLVNGAVELAIEGVEYLFIVYITTGDAVLIRLHARRKHSVEQVGGHAYEILVDTAP